MIFKRFMMIFLLKKLMFNKLLNNLFKFKWVWMNIRLLLFLLKRKLFLLLNNLVNLEFCLRIKFESLRRFFNSVRILKLVLLVGFMMMLNLMSMCCLLRDYRMKLVGCYKNFLIVWWWMCSLLVNLLWLKKFEKL